MTILCDTCNDPIENEKLLISCHACRLKMDSSLIQKSSPDEWVDANKYSPMSYGLADTFVLITDINIEVPIIQSAYYSSMYKKWFPTLYTVTHWMPAPPFPKD